MLGKPGLRAAKCTNDQRHRSMWGEYMPDSVLFEGQNAVFRLPTKSHQDLDGNASWMFWISISFKIQAGVVLWFATLEKNTYGSILLIGYRGIAVVKQTVDFIHALVPLTAFSFFLLSSLCFFSYCSSTRIRISNTHL